MIDLHIESRKMFRLSGFLLSFGAVFGVFFFKKRDELSKNSEMGDIVGGWSRLLSGVGSSVPTMLA